MRRIVNMVSLIWIYRRCMYLLPQEVNILCDLQFNSLKHDDGP